MLLFFLLVVIFDNYVVVQNSLEELPTIQRPNSHLHYKTLFIKVKTCKTTVIAFYNLLTTRKSKGKQDKIKKNKPEWEFV